MARDEPQVNIRMSADLKGRLEESAKKLGRTLTAEIIFRLEMTFAPGKGPVIPQDMSNREFAIEIQLGFLEVAQESPRSKAKIKTLQAELAEIRRQKQKLWDESDREAGLQKQ